MVVLALFRERFSQALKSVLIWIVIALVLAVGYTYRFELREVADRVMAEFVPGHAATIRGGRTVEISRGQGGNFLVNTQVNGARVSMIFDTGASSVVLTQEAAKAAGLPLEVLTYSVTVDTANGRTRAAPVTLQDHRGRRHRGARGAGADRAAGAIAHEPARHELPQPAAGLGGARRPAGAAGVSVSARRPRITTPGSRETAATPPAGTVRTRSPARAATSHAQASRRRTR